VETRSIIDEIIGEVRLNIFPIYCKLTGSNSYFRNCRISCKYQIGWKMCHIEFVVLISSLSEETGVRHFAFIRHVLSQYLQYENRKNTSVDTMTRENAVRFRCIQFRSVRLSSAQVFPVH
jgi:hypothetical protein